MSVEYAKSDGSTMHGHGGPERYRLVLVVGALLVVMTAVIVGVTVWVVTQQTGGEGEPRTPSETVVSYVGWEDAAPPESDSRIIGEIRTVSEASPTTTTTTTTTAATPESGAASLDSAQIQASLAQLGPNRQLQLQPGQLQPGDYSQNVVDVMKQLQLQQMQQAQLMQLGQQIQQGSQRQPGVRQGGTIQSYGVLETYQHDLPPAWPPVPNPNRVGQAFEGVAQPLGPAFGASGDGAGGWNPQDRPQDQRLNPHQDRTTDRHGERLGEMTGGARGGQGMGLRPFPGEPERPAFARRGEEGRPFRRRRPPPPFRSREAANRTYATGDTATNAGLDLAVSGWSAFSFGMFLLKKLVQIMGYGKQSRMVPDESSMFLRALDVAGKIAGFDASAELEILGEGLSEGRAFSESPAAEDGVGEPDLSRIDLVNGLFRVGLNMVSLFTSEGELNVSECLWGAYCEDLQRRSGAGNVDGIVAKVNSIGLKLIRGDVEDYIGVGQMMNMIQDFEGSQCQKLFPACHGTAAMRFMGDLLGGA